MDWSQAYDVVKPYVFRIQTPDGSGTGFLFGYNEAKTFALVATAWHVVDDAEDWKKPIRLTHEESGETVFLVDSERVIFPDRKRDTAAILVPLRAGLFGEALPEQPLAMIEADKFIRIGNPVGWVGYPAVAMRHLCFFRGYVSAFRIDTDAYLIDGVAINGVSGGPVFTEFKGKPRLIGSVSAYLPNRRAGDALPGLLEAQDVTPLQETLTRLRSVDEARKKREAEKKEAEAPESSTPGNAAPGADEVGPNAGPA